MERNNHVLSEAEGNELVATWGTRSVANRMLSFAYKRFDGVVPEPGALDAEDRALLEKVEAGLETVGALPQERPASSGPPWAKPWGRQRRLRRVAREANGYTFASLSACLDRKAPWFQIKEDPQAAATSVYVTRSVRVVDNLKTILAPTRSVPHTAQRLHEYLGYDGQLFGTQQVVEYQEETRSHLALTYDHSGAVGMWGKSELPPGQALREPAPLFKKLDESVVEEEYARIAA